MKLILASPRGFCAGVNRAITIVERALEMFGKPIYVRHEVVHNRIVVEELRGRGAVFVEELSEVPDGAMVIFSAHGVSRSVEEEAERRDLRVLDATCPLVSKVHMEVLRYAHEGRDCVLIGHVGHPEVEGTMGRYDERHGGRIHLVENLRQAEALEVSDPSRLAYVTQTTLSVDDTRRIIETLRRRFPEIIGPRRDDICYATQNRQDVVRDISRRCDVILVIGSQSSSNSNRLRDLAQRQGCRAHLLDSAAELRREWFQDDDVIGLTAGASAPEVLVQEVVAALSAMGAEAPTPTPPSEENVYFALPRELRVVDAVDAKEKEERD